MCLQTFIAISKKLWPVGRDKVRADKQTKKSDKLVHVTPKPEVPSLSSIYRWIQLGAHNFFPETVPLYHFRFWHYRSKTADSVEFFYRIKI